MLRQPASTITGSPTLSSQPECEACSGNGWTYSDGTAKRCPCQREKRILRELPPLYRQAKLADFSAEVQEHVRRWLDSPGTGLLLSGTVGSGKTHLASAIVRERIGRDDPASFRRMADLYAALRESFRLNTSEAEVLRPYVDARLIVLDDLGAGGLSDFERRSTLEILEQRLIQERPTIVTTNWSLPEIGEKMDDRIASRLATYTILRLAGSDRRLAGPVPKTLSPRRPQTHESASPSKTTGAAPKRNVSGAAA